MTKERLTTITASTLLPLGTIAATFLVAVAVVRYVDKIAFTTDANAVAIDALQRAQMQYAADMVEVKTGIAVIKSRLPERRRDSR